jgi:hypothetical protein
MSVKEPITPTRDTRLQRDVRDEKAAVINAYLTRLSNLNRLMVAAKPDAPWYQGSVGVARDIWENRPDVSRMPGSFLPELPSDFTFTHKREDFIPLAKWTGRVIGVGSSDFVAIVSDQLTGDVEEDAQIPLDEVSQHDMPLLREGAWFYWTIGYRIDSSGQRSRQSVVRFQRLPTWSLEEIERARAAAESVHLNVEQ